MKNKPTEHEKTTNEWVVHGQYSLPDDHPQWSVLEPQKHTEHQKLFKDRFKEIEEYEYYLEFSKKAPTKAEQADFLEKMYGLLVKFARNLVEDEITCYEKYERPKRLEIERLKHQSFN